MVRFILFLLLAGLAVFIYFDANITVYGNWYKNKDGNISMFGKEIKTINVKGSSDSDVEYFVLYDETKKGIYCLPVENVKKMYVCTPMRMKQNEISKEDVLTDVLNHSESKNGFFAEFGYINFVAFKTLNIKIMPLDLECINTNKICDFKMLDRYISFNSDIVEKLYISFRKGKEIK